MSSPRLSALVFVGVLLVSALLASCSSESEWTPLTLRSSESACAGQRAAVPASGTAYRVINAANADLFPYQAATYASYEMRGREVWVDLFFDPSLPLPPSTDNARPLLQYALVQFQIAQPGDLGGSLELLSASVNLHLADFDRFEVVDGQLQWRLVKSADHYVKMLNNSDADPTNDPPSGVDCLTGDLSGMCFCEFSGPSVDVTIEGSTPL